MSTDEQWLMRIEGALSAHFFQADGSSRPGTDWSVGLKRGDETYNVLVRAYLDDRMTKRARADTNYQAQTVMGYLNDLLTQGWTPEQGGELSITIQNPTGEIESAEEEQQQSKPWWKLW
ncbi:MAG: hypothetical protein QOD28_118 [Acidobacteriota bacterium]|nr:hypothetical protein [Acidobacteriota bacterium]